jgi:PadR family transcriptional regulator, regulatory protein AphA
MENVVLGLLIIQSLTLYELNQAFKQGISMFYSASYGSLQIAVKNLLGKGMIIFEERVDKGRNKKIYSITEQGKIAFYRWMREEIPANKLEVTALSKVYFLGLLQGAEQKEQVLNEILSMIQLVQGELSEMEDALSRVEISEPYREIYTYQLKTLDYGRKAHAFAREWFQGLLDELEYSKNAGDDRMDDATGLLL